MIKLVLYFNQLGDLSRTYYLRFLIGDTALHGGTQDGTSFDECSCVYICITYTETCSVSIKSYCALFVFTYLEGLWGECLTCTNGSCWQISVNKEIMRRSQACFGYVIGSSCRRIFTF